MPIEVWRFGVGHRRPQGPDGSEGVDGQVIFGDARGVVTELAFGRNARLIPHESPNSAWLVVIEGGGWVQVAEERRRVAAGDVVSWPAGTLHAAWTEQSHMRAIQVELSGADDAALRGIIDLSPRRIGPGAGSAVGLGMGALAEREPDPDSTLRDGEPL